VGPIASNSIHLYMRVPTNLISGSHPPHKHLTCGSCPQLARWVPPTSRPRPTKWVPPRSGKSVPHSSYLGPARWVLPRPAKWVLPNLPTQVGLALDLACGFRPELTSGSHLDLPSGSRPLAAPDLPGGSRSDLPTHLAKYFLKKYVFVGDRTHDLHTNTAKLQPSHHHTTCV
jgi:hypothetical protein